jgi:signal transduction histidine kinase/ligand-binding sensor domain-containing protein
MNQIIPSNRADRLGNTLGNTPSRHVFARKGLYSGVSGFCMTDTKCAKAVTIISVVSRRIHLTCIEQTRCDFLRPIQVITRTFCVWLTIALLLSTLSSGADRSRAISQFTHTSWTAKDGLPGPVRAIAQTQDGYLWLGTEAGLYRFDGLQFVLWAPSNGERLPGISVGSLHAAEDGSLWIGFGTGGVSRLYRGRLTSYPPGEGVPLGGILSIVSDHSGTVWIAGEYGFSRFRQGRWHAISADEGYSAPAAQTLLVDHHGTLWVATDGYNFHLSKNPTRPNTVLFLSPGADRFSTTGVDFGQVWQMTEAPDGGVWAADTSGHAVERVSNPSERNSLPVVDEWPLCLLFGSDRSLWIGLIDHGIRRIRDITQEKPTFVDSFQASDGMSRGLVYSTVYSTLEDREGNIWFGTGSGLDRFRKDKFTPYSAREGLIPDQRIALTSTADGSVWLVDYGGDSVRQFRGDHSTSVELPRYSRADTTRILSLYADRDNDVWLGGSFQIAHRSGRTFAFTAIPALTAGEMVEAITKDADGNLWVTATKSGTVGAVFRQNRRTWTDVRAVADLPHFRCRVLYGDPLGRVWLGFEDGEVALYEQGRFHLYSSKDGLFDGRVLTITSDRSGNTWIGGVGGLSHFESGHFTTLTKENGLPGGSVAAIIEDGDGYVWLAGGLGVLRVTALELTKALHSQSHRLEGLLLDANDGLRGLPRQGEPFPVAARGKDGRIWFATTEGVAVIDPQHISKNGLPPPVNIEEVKADDQTFAPSPGLRLRPRTRNLQFKFAALSLVDPGRVRFRYRLEGFDDNWRGPVSERQVTYTNLPARSYRFHVIACNNDGVWNEEGATLEFAILPAFYQTDWFLLVCFAAGACLVWVGYRWRLRSTTARLDSQYQERLAERTRIAQDLHDTLLQGCISASMQLSVANRQLPADSPAKSLVSDVLELMNHVVDDGRNAVRGMRLSGGDSDDLEVAFSRIPRELAVQEPIRFRVIVEGQVRPLHPVIRDEVYRIGREALVNAFRHAQATNIEVELEYSNRELRVCIRDNGSGIDSLVLRSGREGHWGLSVMRERAAKIGARIKVWSGAEGGTEVGLSVPSHIAFRQHSPRGLRRLVRFGPRRDSDSAAKRESE